MMMTKMTTTKQMQRKAKRTMPLAAYLNGLQHTNKSEMQMQPRSDTELQMTDNKQEKETPVLMQTGIVSVCKALLQRHAMPDGAGYACVQERTSAGRLAAVRTVLDDETEEADRLCELPDASKAKLARLSALMEYNSKLVCPSLRQGQQDRHAEAHVAPTQAVIDTAHGTSATGATEKVSLPNKAQPLD